MTINIEIKKGNNENPTSMLRRFQKKVQESGILPKVRSHRYADRELSKLKTKRAKLKKIAGGIKYDRSKRLGTLIERKKKR